MINQRTDIKWTPKIALDFLDGKIQLEGLHRDLLIEASAVLIGSGVAWTLKGQQKRILVKTVESCIINREGLIDWYELDMYTQNS